MQIATDSPERHQRADEDGFSPARPIRRPLGAPPRRTRWVFCRGCRSALEPGLPGEKFSENR